MADRGLLAKVQRWVNLSPAERMLLTKACFLILMIRFGLALFPFFKLRRWVNAEPSKKRFVDAGMDVSKIRWAVQAASRYIPGSNLCLVQAFAGEILCKYFGIPANLRLGVLKGESHLFRAHAWLESGGQVILDSSKNNDYIPLPSWENQKP